MSKKQVPVEEVIANELSSSLCKNFSLNSKKQKRKGFSVAEAMIALLIGSVALGMAAPMITKQIKQSNFADAQARLFNQRMNDLVENNANFRLEIEELIDEKIREVREEMEDIPSGMVAFFNTTTCPNGWSAISSNWRGRFPRFAGQYTVLSYNTSKKAFNTTGTAQTLSVGATQEDAIRNITGTGPAFIVYGNQYYVHWLLESGAMYHQQRTGTTKIHGAGNLGNGTNPNLLYFDASRVVPISVENRPRSVALLGCVKK